MSFYKKQNRTKSWCPPPLVRGRKTSAHFASSASQEDFISYKRNLCQSIHTAGLRAQWENWQTPILQNIIYVDKISYFYCLYFYLGEYSTNETENS